MPAPTRSVVLAAALLLPPAVAAGLWSLGGRVAEVNVVLALVLVVVAVAVGGSRLAGLLVALSAAAWFEFFFLPPELTFVIAQRDDVETAVLFGVVGLAVTEIVLWGRRQQESAGLRQGYLDGVVSATGLVADGDTSADTVLTVVARQIADLLEVDSCEYVDGPPTNRPRLHADGSVTRGGTPLDVDRSGLPANDVLEVPVTRGGVARGRFVLTATSRVVWTTPDQRRVAVVLADQAASVLPAPRA